MSATAEETVDYMDFEVLDGEFAGENTLESERFTDEPDYLHKRFVMIHGTDCCWDKDSNDFIKCSHLRLSAPNAYPLWHRSPAREVVEAEKIVFDPEGKRTDGIINMFKGFPVTPRQGDNTRLLDHLFGLCQEDKGVFDWIIKWVAYPLQHPGAKMATAVVFHGKEGTGKNIFWDSVKAIYGVYGVPISQSQIETEFNAWMSAKLFVLANEVLSRRERRHIKGRLKALVTENIVMINQKNMPIRTESNHANFVFLSNEIDPIDTDKHDRRYMVVSCEEVYSKDYYRDLSNSIDIPAFYHYMLAVDLGDFSPHTPPIVNDAKQRLMNLNLRSEQLFLDDWLDGESTDFPLMDVPSLSLYWAYRCWCEERGEKYPCSETRFGRAIADTRIQKSRANVVASSKKVMMCWVDRPRSSVSLFEFEAFDQILNGERQRYRI